MVKSNLGREASDAATVKLAVLGMPGGSHIGASLSRAAAELGIRSIWFDASKAFAGPRLLRSLSWHLADRRPLYLNQFSNELVKACARARPEIIVATGMAPLTESGLRALRQLGIVTGNYSADNTWDPAMRSNRHLGALPLYDLGFPLRRRQLDDCRRLGCPKVHYLQFGYDESLFASALKCGDPPSHDVLFVGGADADRAAFLAEFMHYGPPIAVAGG